MGAGGGLPVTSGFLVQPFASGSGQGGLVMMVLMGLMTVTACLEPLGTLNSHLPPTLKYPHHPPKGSWTTPPQ